MLVVELPKHKGDQEGKNAYPKHVHANPNDPSVCTILNLGLKIMCTPKISLVDNRVFGGGSPENKFSKWLVSLFNTISHSEMMTLGLFLKELGTHSFRKGGGPSMISVYHRAGWSIGNVQQRYIFPMEAIKWLAGFCVEASGTLAIFPHFVEGAITHEQ